MSVYIILYEVDQQSLLLHLHFLLQYLEINVLDRNIRITNLPKEQCPPFSHDLAIIRSRQLHFSRLFLVRAGKLDVDECEFSHNTLQWQREQQQWISGQGQFYSSLGVNDALIYMSGNGQITLSRCRLGRLTSGLESFLVADNGILNITTFSCIDTYELEQQPGDVGPPQVVSATFTFLKSAIGIGSDVKQAVISGANFHSVTTTQSEGSVLEIVLGDESVIEIKQSAFLKCQSANSGGGAIFIDTQYSRTTRNSQTNNNNNRHQYRRLNKNYKSRNEDASISIVECQFLNCTSSDQLRGSNTKAQVLGKTAVVGGGAVFIIGERPVTWFNRCFFQDNQVRLSVSANTTEYSLRWAVVGHDVHFGQLKTTDSDPALIFEDCYSQQTRSSGTIQQQRQKIHFEDQQQEGQYDVLLSVHFKTIYVARAGTSSTVLNTNAPIGTLQNPYPTINDAIIQMNTISKITTTVMVAHGIFAEQSQDIDTRIELVGSSPTWCVIRSSYATSGPLYKVIRSGDATLREFTITHRDPRSQESVLSVRGKGASLTVRQCVFKPAGMDKANENGAELSEESASVYDNINTRQLNQMLATQARNRPNTVEFSYTGRKLGNPVSHTEGSQDVPFGQRVQNSAYIEINGGSLALHSVTFEPTTVSGRQIPACVYGVKVRALTMFGVEFQRTIAEEDTEIGNWGAMHAVDVQMATVTATSAGEPHIPGIVLIKDCIFSGEQTSYLSDEAILEAEEEERLLYEEEKGKEQEWEDDYQPPSYDETNTNVDQTQNTEIHSSKPVIQTNDVSSQYTELPASHSFYYYRLPECGFGTPAVHIKGGIVAVVGTQFVKCIDGALRLTDVYNASIGSTNLFRDNWDELVDRGGIPITEEEAEEDVLKMVQWNQTFGQKNKKKISNRHLQPMSIESDAFEHFEKQVFCEGSTTLYGSIDSFVSNRLTDKEIEKIREQSVKEGKEKNKEPLWIMYDDDCNFGGELAQNGIVQSPYVVPNLKVIQSRSKKVTKNVIIPMSALAQKNEATANRIKDSLRKKKQNPDLFDVEIKAKVQENTLQIKGDYLSPCGRMFLELQDKKNEQLVLLIDLIEQTSEQPSISSNANEPTQLTSLDTLSVIKSGTWYSEKKIELKFDQLLSASADSYGVITDTVYSGGWKARLIFVKGKEQEGFWAGAEGRATKQKSISHWLAGWEIALIVIFVLLGVAIIIAIIIGLIMYNNKRKSGDVRDAYHARTQEPTRDVSDRSEQRNDEEMEQYAMEV
ncbi:MAG: hypothetical protein EZS28_019000 [Streblomastix strix]|uniref:Uncharacterized protein n=1 Tax=Streblomastix strix TaxID=222440 RepID=A0A5J4VS86_9EUKA|nr:MAG: hypothetical protein EZS28_019000 [Streblomastix strix]